MNTVDPLKKIEDATQKIHRHMSNRGSGVFRRYPLTFSLLTTFGIASVLYGFEGIIELIPVLKDSPIIVFFIGASILLFTGTLYKRLRKF